MKKLIAFTALFLFISAVTFAQKREPAKTKNLVEKINPQGASFITLGFDKDVAQAQIWKQPTIHLELVISANFPKPVVAQLVKAGRYTLSTELKGGRLNIVAKDLEKDVTVGGKKLEDNIKVSVYIPRGYTIRKGRLAKGFDAKMLAKIMRKSENKDQAQKAVKKMSMIEDNIQVSYRFIYNEKGNNKKEEAPALAPAASERTMGTKQSLKDIQARFGDILISGEPIEFELD